MSNALVELEELKQKVISCKKCPLFETRKNAVFGEGNINNKIMFIGEAPGFNEDVQGRPFVGRAGKLLGEILNTVGLKREDIYITNVVKCRPPENRDPLPSEIKACFPYLEKQISIIKPKIMVCLGRHSSKQILEKFNQKFNGISTDHGKIFNISTLFGPLVVIPTHHPAAALYNPELKETIINDFKTVKRFM